MDPSIRALYDDMFQTTRSGRVSRPPENYTPAPRSRPSPPRSAAPSRQRPRIMVDPSDSESFPHNPTPTFIPSNIPQLIQRAVRKMHSFPHLVRLPIPQHTPVLPPPVYKPYRHRFNAPQPLLVKPAPLKVPEVEAYFAETTKILNSAPGVMGVHRSKPLNVKRKGAPKKKVVPKKKVMPKKK